MDKDKKIEDQIKELLSDQEFETLNLSLKEPNIFHILEDTKKELKHSNFLAYLLNPNENHGLGEIFLQRFIREVFSSEVEKGCSRSVMDIVDLNYSDVTVLREWRNIDILIVMQNDVFCIENKVNITDHSGQLKRYREIVNKQYSKENKHYIYLSPFGEMPTQEGEANYYHCMSYQTIVDLLTSLIEVYKSRLTNSVIIYLSDYITAIKRNILMSDELNAKAAKLYAKYADAIEMIYSSKPDSAEYLYKYFENALIKQGFVIGSKNKGFVRFTTKDLQDLLKGRTGTGWPNKEVFLFEIDYYWSDKNAVLKATISPCDDDIKKKILDSVNGKDYYQKPKGDKWVVFHNDKKAFVASNMVNESDEKIEKDINVIIDSVADTCRQIATDIENGLKKNGSSENDK